LSIKVCNILVIVVVLMYAIIDIETTGGNHNTGKITEIAIYIHNGNRIVDEFSTLINPEVHIPKFIQNFTGITNEMVKDAPKFYEVAKKIVEITNDKIFVAHNVMFDYGFIKHEFKCLGYDYNRNKLCTVRLSRKLLPGHKSYSLGKLTGDLKIQIANRHRAAGDAIATVKLFEILLEKSSKKNLFAH
jgi:DNA polymerase III subunit epsilon